MTTMNITAAPARPAKRFSANPASAGLPDPRPLTEYSVDVIEQEGKTTIKVILSQPCIIRKPVWGFVDCSDGSVVFPKDAEIEGNDTIYFEFESPLSSMVAIIDVPYQDMQVQNFQGGFVRPGGRWFRRPE
jgi:hypothetical protein